MFQTALIAAVAVAGVQAIEMAKGGKASGKDLAYGLAAPEPDVKIEEVARKLVRECNASELGEDFIPCIKEHLDFDAIVQRNSGKSKKPKPVFDDETSDSESSEESQVSAIGEESLVNEEDEVSELSSTDDESLESEDDEDFDLFSADDESL